MVEGRNRVPLYSLRWYRGYWYVRLVNKGKEVIVLKEELLSGALKLVSMIGGKV